MFKADIVLQITFDFKKPDKTIIRTNAKKEAVEEILEAWLSCQIGQGKDESKHNEKDEYKIEIQLDLSDDTFRTNSDTGNKGFTCGIIMDILGRLNEIEILDLS